MRRFILSIFITGLLSVTAFAQIQPGSTGGTIGKQDKSISGGEGADAPRVAPHPQRSATKSQETSSGHSCNRIVGDWTWYLGISAMEFFKEGIARHSSGVTGTWKCTNTTVNAVYSNGSKEQYAISQDGNSLFVTSSWGGGVKFTATRRSGD